MVIQANGFYNAHGISGRVPEAYTLLEQRFMAAVQSARRSGVSLNEWEKDGWTYHAKGLSYLNFLTFLPSHHATRHMDSTHPNITSGPNSLWFDQPELALLAS